MEDFVSEPGEDWAVGGGGWGVGGLYFTGDSFSRNLRRLGSRSRYASPLVASVSSFLPDVKGHTIEPLVLETGVVV